MTIKIVPFDTVFFRNARPFSMGEDTWADNIFPPNPGMLYGALRTAYVSQVGDLSASLNSINEITKELVIKAIYLHAGQSKLFPLPLDLVVEKEQNSNLAEALSVVEESHLGRFLTTIKENQVVQTPETSYLWEEELEAYLHNTRKKIQIESAFEVKKEPKIGIRLNKNTRSTNGEAEGYLYRVEMARLPDDSAFVLEFEGNEILEDTVVRLGGEGKLASIQVIDESLTVPPPKIDKYFKWYLLTPAFFKKGWLPDWLDEQSKIGSPAPGLRLNLLTAVTGKPVPIGGWDMKKNQPKLMLKAVPAGAVYYFEILEGNPENVIELFHQKSISESFTLPDDGTFVSSREGYGVTMVGTWSPDSQK